MRVLVTLVIICFSFPNTSICQRAATIACKIEAVSLNLDVSITLSSGMCDSWNGVHYDDEKNEQTLIRYLDMLEQEYNKYPPGFLRKVNVETIVLVKDLSFRDQPRAAVPDPYKKQLFLSVNGAYGIASHRYLAHVMHHELHHCTEYTLWKSMTYDWTDWMQLNEEDFCYGNGGAAAYDDYKNKSTDFYTPNNPRKGFINLYSMTGDEEDRAELIAFLMTEVEKPTIVGLCQKDDILRKKATLLITLLLEFTQETFQFAEVLN